MIMERLSTKALLFAALQITTQALPNFAQVSRSKTLTTTSTPTPTIVGLPAIATITNTNCNVEGSLPAESIPYHNEMSYYDPLQCMYACMQTTFCQSYSWNTTDAAFNNRNCFLYSSAGIPGLPVVAGETGVFFSGKSSSCYKVAPPKKMTSKPFAGERGVYVNTAVSDCGIEGSLASSAGTSPPANYRYDSVLDCQALCDSENGCTSYSWDTNTTGNNCAYSYAWLAGRIVPGRTGVYWSEGAEKTGYPCFSDKPVGA
ncbi:uncharacterized protein BP5553_09482 [Venustampulla echinocandica]|uniref:Apple domain-containing protein n=1 Tax=Venustampulla echinocandica TaxID=2656787 RepID=A0A370TCU2_9HELO|nr:uncharacterized protein BP5553_09482 [Venustampulla echinocandica]RDL32080.1 hypothetical protein BP5553_09482 [Venustampulla echinocandica]